MRILQDYPAVADLIRQAIAWLQRSQEAPQEPRLPAFARQCTRFRKFRRPIGPTTL